MAKLFPVRFNYIPYPLWRRKMPFPFGFMTKPLWHSLYPVYEDKNPPDDAATMADYLVRYGLMPDLEMRTIYNALHTSPAEIEHVPAGVANPAPASPIRILRLSAIMSKCTGACGSISRMATQTSSSCSMVAGISRSIIFSKRVFSGMMCGKMSVKSDQGKLNM